MFADNLGEVARAALDEGAAGLSRFSLRLLSPVSPMLASTAEDVEEALERLGEAAFEYKVDGARIQVHKAGDEVRVFTRQLQDVTDRVPEVVEWARALPAARAGAGGRSHRAPRRTAGPSPSRSRCGGLGSSKDVAGARAQALPLSSFFFDCLYVEGEGSLVVAALRGARRSGWRRRSCPAALLPRIVTRRRRTRRSASCDQALAAGPRRADGQVAGARPTPPASAASTG